MDARSERIPLLWSIREKVLDKGFNLVLTDVRDVFMFLRKSKAAWKGCTQYKCQRHRQEMSLRRS